MADLTNEKEHLLKAANVHFMSPQQECLATVPEQDKQTAVREWNGHLLSMFGNFDHSGVSTFAYVKLLSPLAWGHNVQRALGWSFWRHTIVFLALFSLWGFVLVNSFTNVNIQCGPTPPDFGTDITRPQPNPIFEPKALQPDQQFLTGATFNPAFVDIPPKKDQGADWETLQTVEDLGDKATSFKDDAVISSGMVLQQVQDAKLQATESMAQLDLGRKLLHKPKHDEDDDDDDDEEAKHNDDKHKMKKDKKMNKKAKDEKKFKHPKGPQDLPHHAGPESPECLDAQKNLGFLCLLAFITTAVGLVYVVKVRTAIRTRFGIKGSKTKDCLAWTFCSPCALCQESRTLTENNVKDGVWYGPTILTAPVQEPCQAPQAVKV